MPASLECLAGVLRIIAEMQVSGIHAGRDIAGMEHQTIPRVTDE